MNELKLFENPEFGSIRIVEIDNAPWWVLSDVCKALDLSNPTVVANRLEHDERSKFDLGRQGNATIISESGLYSVILRSDKPQAKAFKRWVTHEVIPSIRRHGAYMTDDVLKKALTSPDFLIRLATELKSEKEKNQRLENKIEADKPKVIFADAVSVSQRSILVGELAKLLRQNGVKIGQNRLFEWMRENGYLMNNGRSYNMPTQYSMERGLFEVKETPIIHSDGYTTVNFTPKVTGKGQLYFINLFLSSGKEDDDDD